LVLAIAGSAMVPALAGDAPEVQRGTFSAPIMVKADGSIEVGEIDGAEGPVVAVIRRKLAALHYFPAHRDGVAVTTSAHLSGTVILKPVDGQYEVAIADVSLAPWLQKGEAPVFPADRCRADASGTVELMVRIGADGRVLDTRTVSATHPDFATAAQSAAKHWRFSALPEGEAWSEIPVPILFFARRNMKISPFQCDAEGRARVEGEPGCLDRFEVVCTHVRVSI
jgi:TonB family protein